MKKFFQVCTTIKEVTALCYTAAMCFYLFFQWVFKQETAPLSILFSLLLVCGFRAFSSPASWRCSKLALAKAEGFIDDFLARDFRSILLCRSTEPVGEDLLFAGETEFYEGFLGREGLPLAVTDRNGDGSCVLEGSLRALIG